MRRLVAVLWLAWCGACGLGIENVSSGVEEPDMGGAARIAVHLPVPEGTFVTCTQGAGGTFSHTARSTAHDLDFDTSNTADEELFAPVSGRLRVHDAHPAENFGIHVNIDLGDGTYVVLGHLKRVFVRDGAYVAAGQLIAHEGCTGLCTGDHVHVGRHLGDASRPAEYGQSVPLLYYVRSLTAGGGLDTFAGDEARCGVGTGARYVSGLKTVLWHPNGSLLKVPDRETLYLVDQGALRAFADADALASRGYRPEHALLVSATETRCYSPGSPLAGRGSAEVPASGFRDGSLVKEEDKSDVYVISDGAALPVWDEDTFRLMGYAHREIFTLPIGAVRRTFFRVGECVTDHGCLLPTTPVRCGGAFIPPDEGMVPPVSEEPPDAGMPPPPQDEERDKGEEQVPPMRILALRWDAPAGVTPTCITLSGEYRLADGSYRLWWGTLASTRGLPSVIWSVPDVHTGDTLRFSVEFAQENGAVSWSCLGPYPDHPTVQGVTTVSIDGQSVPVRVAGDPASSGCGLAVTVP